MTPRRKTIHLSVFLCFGGALWLSYKVVKVDIPTSGVVRLMRCTSLATGHPPKSMSFAKFVARTSQLEVPPIQIYYVKYLAQSLSTSGRNERVTLVGSCSESSQNGCIYQSSRLQADSRRRTTVRFQKSVFLGCFLQFCQAF